MFDAYTVKKMLPRLIIAVILVNVSWYICVSLLETTSVIGNSIKDIMWAPFVQAGYEKSISIGGQLGLLIWGAASIAIPAGIAWTFLGGGWAVILTSLLTLAGFVLLALVILTLREVVLIFLIIISPLALVAWVLPGTEQWAKRWWGLYTKLLLMFPAFMGLLAMGEIMSTITNKNEGGTSADPAGNLIAIVMYIIPFFMLPFLFKAMGGFLGQITGMINDREKGLLDRSKNWSKEKTGTSILKAEKDRRKELGAAGRKRAGDERVFNKPRTRWQSIQNRATGGYLGKGVGEADVETLKANHAQELLRRQMAQAKASEAVRSAHQLDAASDVEDFKTSYLVQNPGKTTKDAQNHALDWIANRARKAAADGDQDQFNALTSYLAQQKGEKQLNSLQAEAATTGNAKLTSAWTGAVNNQTTYGDLKGFGAHYTAAIGSGMDDEQLNNARAQAIHGASLADRAAMPSSSWTFVETATDPRYGGSAKVASYESEILANDTARAAYKGQRREAPSYVDAYDVGRRNAYDTTRAYDKTELPADPTTGPAVKS